MRTVLVTGISSVPGYGIGYELSKSGYKVVGIYNNNQVNYDNIETIKFDLRKDVSQLINRFNPDIIIHVAAIGLVDYCEEHKTECIKVNVDATKKLLKYAYKKGIGIIYLSSDYVFDGRKGLYREEDPPNPVNFYGLTKLLGETITATLGGLIIRVSAVFGPGYGRKNFAKVLFEKLISNQKIYAFKDQYLSPTYNLLIGRAIKRIIERDQIYETIYHVAGPRLSRYDYALIVAEILNKPKDLIVPTSLKEATFKAPRPSDSSLNNTKAIQELNIPLNNIKDYLYEYLNNLLNDLNREKIK